MDYLWKVKVIQAVLVLKFILAKNQIKREEHLSYLEKNQNHIIDYERRKAIGKTIGSGRTEKKNDRIIAKRQKRKAMAWYENDSRNLAIVAAYYKNIV